MDEQQPKSDESAELLICLAILKHNPSAVTFGQVRDSTGLPKSTVHYNLKKLVKDGLLEETEGGYKIRNREELLSTTLKHYTSFFGKVLPKYIIFTWFFIGALFFLMVSEVFIPQLKFIGFIIIAAGIIASLRMVYRYKL
jgi:DNA-binding transcriptional ArsR family regulator